MFLSYFTKAEVIAHSPTLLVRQAWPILLNKAQDYGFCNMDVDLHSATLAGRLQHYEICVHRIMPHNIFFFCSSIVLINYFDTNMTHAVFLCWSTESYLFFIMLGYLIPSLNCHCICGAINTFSVCELQNHILPLTLFILFSIMQHCDKQDQNFKSSSL